MTPRERFLKVLNFEKPDRVPMFDFGYWIETIDAWHLQGLPLNVNTYEEVESYFIGDRGFELNMVNRWGPRDAEGINWGVFPAFKQHIVEETEETILYEGEGGKELVHKTSGSLSQVLEYPVHNLKEYEEKVAPRMNGKDKNRLYPGFKEEVNALRDKGEPVGIWLDGFLEFPREMIGVQNLCYAYYDDPAFILGMNEQHCQFNMDLSSMVRENVEIDYACIVEDMAGNQGSLVSQKIWNKFMKPYTERLIDHLHKLGVKKILFDSDGNTYQVCKWISDVGIDGHYPVEVRAGNDLMERRKEFPNMAFIGGVDKFELMKEYKDIDAELERLIPLIEMGGFIPSIDHKVPPTISFKNYLYYLEKKADLLDKYGK